MPYSDCPVRDPSGGAVGAALSRQPRPRTLQAVEEAQEGPGPTDLPTSLLRPSPRLPPATRLPPPATRLPQAYLQARLQALVDPQTEEPAAVDVWLRSLPRTPRRDFSRTPVRGVN